MLPSLVATIVCILTGIVCIRSLFISRDLEPSGRLLLLGLAFFVAPSIGLYSFYNSGLLWFYVDIQVEGLNVIEFEDLVSFYLAIGLGMTMPFFWDLFKEWAKETKISRNKNKLKDEDPELST